MGIDYPILSAGMGPTLIGENAGAPVELVVAVSEAGGLAGQVSGLIKEIKPAARVLEEMVEEAVEILTRRLPENVAAK